MAAREVFVYSQRFIKFSVSFWVQNDFLMSCSVNIWTCLPSSVIGKTPRKRRKKDVGYDGKYSKNGIFVKWFSCDKFMANFLYL